MSVLIGFTIPSQNGSVLFVCRDCYGQEYPSKKSHLAIHNSPNPACKCYVCGKTALEVKKRVTVYG